MTVNITATQYEKVKKGGRIRRNLLLEKHKINNCPDKALQHLIFE